MLDRILGKRNTPSQERIDMAAKSRFSEALMPEYEAAANQDEDVKNALALVLNVGGFSETNAKKLDDPDKLSAARQGLADAYEAYLKKQNTVH